MQSLTMISLIGTIAVVSLIVVVYIFGLVNKNKSIKPSIIFAKYSKKKLQPVSRGIVAGTSYLQYSADSTSIISMTLTCSFMTHLYCFSGSEQTGVDQHLVAKTKLSRVESNLMPANFHIYCIRADETKLKELFDTQVLSFLSEFCNNYDLEIADNQVVYALKQSNPEKDSEAAQLADGELLYNMVNPKIIEWYKQIQDEFVL